ncbi:MAG: DUF4167 domain-containing protein [Pseudomonadota bacterium]
MRPGLHMKRQRGRNDGHKPHIPVRSQTFDSNGPDVRVRGNAYQVLEKYLALASDATAAGDRIATENFYQHAEHYYRLIHAGQDPYNRPPMYPQDQQRVAPPHDNAAPVVPGAGPQPPTGGPGGSNPTDRRPF